MASFLFVRQICHLAIYVQELKAYFLTIYVFLPLVYQSICQSVNKKYLLVQHLKDKVVECGGTVA